MSASTGARCPVNIRRYLWLALVVFSRIGPSVGQQSAPRLNTASLLNDAVGSLSPVNIVRRLASSRQDPSGSGISAECSKQVTLLEDGLRNGSSWALQMIDASSKIPSGILVGNQKDLGMYDECVDVKAIEGEDEIRGRHCEYAMTAGIGPMVLSEVLSVCMPSTCKPEDIELVLNDILESVKIFIGANISASRVTCTSLEQREWTAGGIVTLAGFSAFLLFLFVCTAYDVFSMYRDTESNKRSSLLRQFSFYTNACRILSTKTSPQTLPALQGLRFLSMCWVILGHEHFMYLFAATVNKKSVVEWVTSWKSLYILAGPFSVDSFFTMSGFLMSYLFLKEMSTGRSFNIIAYYVHRYVRLTPAYAALLLISIFILPRLGSGADWEAMTQADVEICQKTWWSLLLYVHNYVNKGCIPHTWYLAAEMHYFWVSPFILYPLAKKPKIGLVILFVCIVTSIVLPAKISYDNHYTMALFPGGDPMPTMETMTNFYMESHVRAAPWLIGVFFGYLVFSKKRPSRVATKWIGWFLSFAAIAFCVFSTRKFQQEGYKYEAVWETFYVLVARPSWAAAVSWIIYASIFGFGGPIAKLLSFSIYHPLSRLSYCAYLVHYVILMTKIYASRVPRYYSDLDAFNTFLSDLLWSLSIGFAFSLLFESPFLAFEKIVRSRCRTGRDETKKELTGVKVENGIDNPALTPN